MSKTGLSETLLGLVQRYSPSGDEQEAVGYLVERMSALGYSRAEKDAAGNAVGIMGDGPKQIVLLGHIDTVPGEIAIERNGDLLFGRGTVDAKGPLAAFVDAVAALGPQPGWQCVVIGAVDEERDSLGAQYVAESYRPQMVIIGEPSHWQRITLGYKGSAWCEIEIRRRMAHTAGRSLSACEAAVEFWQTICAWAENYNEGRQGAFEQVQPTLRKMESGDEDFEAWARLRVGVRLPLDVSPEIWYQALHSLQGEAKIIPTGFALPAYRADKNSALVRGFLAAIRSLGGQPGFLLKTGTADFNLVGPRWGCPILAYGPGDSALDHTPQEHLSLTEYGLAVEVLKSALQKIAVAAA